MANKVIYLGTTYKCSACKCQEVLLKEALADRKDIELKVLDYTELPEFIKKNIPISDFPLTVFTINDVGVMHFKGTRTVKEMKKMIKELRY